MKTAVKSLGIIQCHSGPPLRAWQGRLDSMIFSPNNSGR